MHLSIVSQMLQEHWCLHGLHSPFSLEMRLGIRLSVYMHTNIHDGEKETDIERWPIAQR